MKNKDIIKFWPSVPGLAGIAESCPKPMKKHVPSWWKDMDNNDANAKSCPSFFDIYANGYVLPMWTDSVIRFVGNEIYWETSHNAFAWESTPNQLFFDWIPRHAQKEFFGVAKAISPWYMKTPKGYSTYCLPVPYAFPEDFTILPGIIHTDKYHSINQQVLFKRNEKSEIFIARGEPLALLVPFKRETHGYIVEEMNSSTYINTETTHLIGRTKFARGYSIHTKE